MSNTNPSATPPPIPPHPPLRHYYTGGDGREAFLRALFDQTAGAYETINAWGSLGLGNWYRRRVLRTAGLGPGGRVLDVGIGTGLVARQVLRLVGPSGLVVGLDPSAGMLAEARRRLPIALIQGRAERLPIADAVVDAVTVGYALRHVADLAVTFAEFHRVLRSGGALIILEIARPERRWQRTMIQGYLRRVVPLLGRGIVGRNDMTMLMDYFWDTIEQCVPPPVVMDAMAGAGFRDVRRLDEFQLFRTYTGRAH